MNSATPTVQKYGSLSLRIIITLILIQTLRFKFTGHPDSVYIFSQVGLESYGRIGIGIIELIAGILILIPKTIWLGALITFFIIAGAVTMHLTTLGIVIKNDGGLLFLTAVFTLILSFVVLYIYRLEIPIIGTKLKSKI